MSPADSQRIPVNKVVLIIALLLAVWVAFLFIPNKTPPGPKGEPVATPSKLATVGLNENPDWDGLPEFFAVWADHANWVNSRTRFAYWNPVDRDYTYNFEAIRVGDGFRFRVVNDMGDLMLGEILADGCPLRFYQPYPIFSDPVFGPVSQSAGLDSEKRAPSKVDVQIGRPKIEVTPSGISPPGEPGPDSPKK